MTNADFEESISGLAEEDLSAVAELLARPFPEGDYQDASGCGGPGFHLVVLEASRDFWDAPDEGVVRAAEANLQARLDALAVKLVAR